VLIVKSGKPNHTNCHRPSRPAAGWFAIPADREAELTTSAAPAKAPAAVCAAEYLIRSALFPAPFEDQKRFVREPQATFQTPIGCARAPFEVFTFGHLGWS
jgi:hypothetical protein